MSNIPHLQKIATCMNIWSPPMFSCCITALCHILMGSILFHTANQMSNTPKFHKMGEMLRQRQIHKCAAWKVMQLFRHGSPGHDYLHPSTLFQGVISSRTTHPLLVCWGVEKLVSHDLFTSFETGLKGVHNNSASIGTGPAFLSPVGI